MPQISRPDGQLTAELREYLLREGANLVGFGAVKLMGAKAKKRRQVQFYSFFGLPGLRIVPTTGPVPVSCLRFLPARGLSLLG